MNKHSLFVFFLFASLLLSAQTPNYQIDGKISERYNGALITLFTFTGDYIRSVDSTYVENGHFYFEGPEYLYEKSLISVGNYPDTVFVAELFLEQGAIEVELKQKSVIRSPFETEYRQYVDSCASINRSFAVKDQTQAFYDAGLERYFAYKFQFKKKYIHNGIGRYFFLDDTHFIDDPYFHALYELLPDKEKQRSDVKDAYETRKKKDAQKLLINKPFLNFSLLNTEDEEKHISDYVGESQLLFLDFWASWCGPCLAQEPNIKELYQKYKDKGFEVLGISLDTSKESWLRAIKEKGISWPELYVGDQERSKELRELYYITGIPYGVLIDRSGKIVDISPYWLALAYFLERYYKNDEEPL